MPTAYSVNVAARAERRLVEGLRRGMSSFFFTCPRTGIDVPGLSAKAITRDDLYVATDCLACGGLHLVKPSTGRVAEADTACNDNARRTACRRSRKELL
jgi:hypothetical protein